MSAHVSPWMNEELNILRDQARRFIVQEFAPQRERIDRLGRNDDAAHPPATGGMNTIRSPSEKAWLQSRN